MNQKYKEPLPLYKQLDAKRTQGKSYTIDNHPVFEGTPIMVIKDEESSQSFRDKYKFLAEFQNVRGDSFTALSNEEREANAQYVNLAFNNFTKVADKLDEVVKQNERILALYNSLYNRTQGGWADAEVADFKEMVQSNKEAKETLKLIS